MSNPLSTKSKKELADLARRSGISRWDTLTKEQLVKTLSARAKKPATKAKPAARPVKTAAKLTTKPRDSKPVEKKGPAKVGANGTARHAKAPTPVKPAAKAAKPAVKAEPAQKPAAQAKVSPPPVKASLISARHESVIPADKDLSSRSAKGTGVVKDQIWLMVSDPHWLHACWELSLQAVQRAEAALGQDWHGAKPVLRLFDVTSQDTTSTSETPVRDIVIHAGCNHWYIDVPQPPRTYRADIGYLSRRGEFRPLARSNVVTPPKAGQSESLPENWAAEIDDSSAERILAMSTGFEQTSGPPQLRELFDEQFRRPTKDNAFGSGAVLPDKLKKFAFDIQTELIVHGRTDPAAHVTLQNEPVKLRPDGTFTMRYALTDGRQIIPAVATASDGMEERTIVLAIERNTKHLDPMVHDLYGEN